MLVDINMFWPFISSAVKLQLAVRKISRENFAPNSCIIGIKGMLQLAELWFEFIYLVVRSAKIQHLCFVQSILAPKIVNGIKLLLLLDSWKREYFNGCCYKILSLSYTFASLTSCSCGKLTGPVFNHL